MKAKNDDRRRHSSITKNNCLLPPCIRCDPPRSICFLEQFSYKHLKKATDYFRRTIIVSDYNPHQQHEGITYEAIFKDGSVALVKEIKGAEEHMDIFYNEVQFLARLHHRHLVALRGYSVGRHRSFVVFESTGYSSLKEHLNNPLKTPLTWKIRLQIAIGVAAALDYLHYFCDPPVYHVSISSNHIMLDDRVYPKLADVGLLSSGSYSVEIPHTSCSKECQDQASRNLIPRFGALILELITGQASSEENADVLQWIQDSRFAMSMDKMVDPDLGNSYDLEAIRSLLAVARLCLKAGDKPAFSISHVFWYLQETVGNLHSQGL